MSKDDDEGGTGGHPGDAPVTPDHHAGDAPDESGLDARLERAVPHDQPRAVGFLLAGDGTQPGRIFPLTRASTVIGRSDKADVRLVQPAVSAEHARIMTSSLGFEVEDLGSVNGTFVNGVRVSRGRLQRGDRLVLGNVEFTFLIEKSADANTALLPPGVRRTAILSHNVSPLRPMPGAMPRRRPRDEEEEEQGPSFADMVHQSVAIWRMVRPHLPLVLSLSLVGAGVGAATAFALPPASVALCEARFDAVKKVNPLGDQHFGGGDEVVQYFTDPERSFLSPGLVRDTLEKVAAGAAGQKSKDAKAAPKPNDELVLKVQQRLRIELDGERTFKTSYQEPFGLLAGRDEPSPVALLDAHVKNYIETDIARGLKKLEEESKYLNTKLAGTVTDLQKINDELAAFKQEHADDLPESLNTALTSRISYENRRGELAAQLVRLRGELTAEEGRDRAPGAINAFTESQRYRTLQQEANGKLAEMQAKGLADGHPEVIKVRDEIARLDKLISDALTRESSGAERETSPDTIARKQRIALLRAQIGASNSELADVDKSLERFRKMLINSPGVGAKLDNLQRDYDTKKKLHDQLAAQSQKATLQLDVERLAAHTRYEIITPAYLMRPPLVKTMGMRGAIGLGAALFIAALIVLVREARKHLHRQGPSSTTLVGR